MAAVKAADRLARLSAEAAGCTNCPLYQDATQTVFGEGPPDARLLLVGEQPGDREDLAGHPFVGPAGRMLDRALDEAGVARDDVFLTNVVKHFKFTRRGKRRIHAKPNAGEINACMPWLRGELEVVDPAVVVALGASAAQALLGWSFRVTKQRGQPVEVEGRTCLATWHPSALLRADDDMRRQSFAELVADLRTAQGLAAAPAA